MHLESISNGLGTPSMLLLVMAIRKEIPATVSITADTGWESDRLWNTGERTTSEEYFKRVVVPLCKGSHVTPYFVRSVDENKLPLDTLQELLIKKARTGETFGIPMFGSRGGRSLQSCTDKMKIRACRQQQRRLGATSGRNAQGIHFYEADRRLKGRFLQMDGKWAEYQTTVDYNEKVLQPDGTIKKVKRQKDIKWQKHYYPAVDLKLGREEIYDRIKNEGIPYLISSECDGCPHQDLALRIPLKEAILKMQHDREEKRKRGIIESQDVDFGCGNSICGV